jgi:uncharacterized protein DUF3788
MGRSSAYWKSNLYLDEAEEPLPTAPLHDLAESAAERFRVLRTGLLDIRGVTEQVRFMGPMWHWTWEYALGNRKLCWVHIMKDRVDATFTLSDADEHRLEKGFKSAKAIVKAVDEGQRTGPVKWCWLGLDDRRVVEAFLTLARRKAEWLAERPAPRRAPRLHGGGADY